MKKNWASVVNMSVLLGKEQGCGNKVNCFLRRELLFHQESFIWVSDKAENASQSI